MHSLVIKGDPATALKAAHDRRIVLLGHYVTDDPYTIAYCDAGIEQLQAWLHEDHIAPFRDGSLLLFSRRDLRRVP